ncbi:MAG TPA: acyl-CoA dehydrogenase family protein, partial [Thermodesulfobacteriota bacterium]|nr:acyl-CoA dehydrogenase family protein [Thermodesulfobacteriota bacterium]
MNYFLTEEQQMIKEIAQKIADEKIKPIRAELDEKEEFPRELLKVMAQSDLFGVYIPQEYGGFGGGAFENCLAVEELSRACLGVSTSFAASGLGAYPILLYGNEAQKKKYLPEIASGRKLAAFGLTESTAGSDVSNIMTTAELKGDEYILNGTKQWITNAEEAEIYSVVAITDRSKGPRGASAFIVEKGDPGFGFGKKEHKMGIRASATGELVFNQCRIPKDRIIAREGMGFIVTMKTFDQSRPGVAAQALGIAQGALDKAIEYSQERKQFGKPISSFQGLQFMLADMATQVEAARSLTYAAAKSIDAGEKDVSRMSAMAK